jgi:riboflavin synthase
MFSGIVSTTVPFKGLVGERYVFDTSGWEASIELGSSIAVNGACLTAVEVEENSFGVEVVEETIRRTNLGLLKPGDLVNVEQSVTLTSLLDGNLVQGHIDTVAKVIEAPPWLRIEMPVGYKNLVVEKGAITINGVALTIAGLDTDSISVAVIPETVRRTNLGLLKPGDLVNVEFDLIGKYLVRQLELRLGHVGSGESNGL